MIIKKNERAFTLIELLVVIAVIGILATLAVIALQQARQNARDAKRVADVKQISTALELYFNDNKLYPETLDELQTEGYMEQLPEAPTPTDEGCEPGENEYDYTVDTERGDYQVSFCTGRQVSDMSPGVLCMTPGGISTNCGEATSGTFVDARDGQEYEWVKIGEQVWMAENLKYLPDISLPSSGSVDDPRYYVYGYNGENKSEAISTENYQTYGVMYNYPAASIACPSGWHLPTHDEFTMLEREICTSITCDTDFPYDTTTQGFRGMDEGFKLKTLSEDNSLWNGSNIFNFSALPAGRLYINGSFYDLGDKLFLWSSSVENTTTSWLRGFHVSYSSINRFHYTFSVGLSVRCLKDGL